MKRLVVMALFAAMASVSCVSKSRVEGVENQRDSLSMVVSAKDSLINIVFEQINSISDNLAQIRTREGLISLGSNEGINRPVEQINNDIASIDRLLQENKTKIASLQSTAAQLRKANLRIDGLEKMIKGLNTQLVEKTNEVAQLRENLSQMGLEVKTLTELVAESEARADNLISEKVVLEDQLHTIYYIVGQERELRDAQIIDKQGFIGRTLTVGNTADLESFTKGDSRLITEIPIGKKGVKVVTYHPEESYELITNADKVAIKLYIKDTERFWSSSKILIISHK